MAKISQEQIVLRHLKKYGSITSMEAFSRYTITRLAAVVFVLRKEHEIETVMRYRNGKQYAEYYLKETA